MKNILLIVSITILTFLSSCLNNVGCKKITISLDETKWLEFGNIGDTFLFKSDMHNLDTFIVTEKEDNNFTDCNLFERGTNQYELNGFSMQRINTLRSYPSKDKEATFVFNKNVNNQSDSFSYKRFTVFDFRTEEFADFAAFPIVDIELTTTKSKYEANFFDRPGVYGNKDGSAVFITSFWWSKKNGLLKYETASGEVFEFLKKF